MTATKKKTTKKATRKKATATRKRATAKTKKPVETPEPEVIEEAPEVEVQAPEKTLDVDVPPETPESTDNGGNDDDGDDPILETSITNDNGEETTEVTRESEATPVDMDANPEDPDTYEEVDGNSPQPIQSGGGLTPPGTGVDTTLMKCLFKANPDQMYRDFPEFHAAAQARRDDSQTIRLTRETSVQVVAPSDADPINPIRLDINGQLLAFTNHSYRQLLNTVGLGNFNGPLLTLADHGRISVGVPVINEFIEKAQGAQLLVNDGVIRAFNGASYARMFDADVLDIFNAQFKDKGLAPIRPTFMWGGGDVDSNGCPVALFLGETSMTAGFMTDADDCLDDGEFGGYRTAILIGNSEVGGGGATVGQTSAWIRKMLFRDVCQNLMIWGTKDVVTKRFYHRGKDGDSTRLEGDIRSYFAELSSDMDSLTAPFDKDVFANALTSPIFGDGSPTQDNIDGVADWLVKHKTKLGMPQMGKKTAQAIASLAANSPKECPWNAPQDPTHPILSYLTLANVVSDGRTNFGSGFGAKIVDSAEVAGKIIDLA